MAQVISVLKLIVDIIKLVIAAWEYASGAISEYQYNSKIKSIKASMTKMDSDNEDEQLEGASELESSFGGSSTDS